MTSSGVSSRWQTPTRETRHAAIGAFLRNSVHGLTDGDIILNKRSELVTREQVFRGQLQNALL